MTEREWISISNTKNHIRNSEISNMISHVIEGQIYTL